MYKRLYLLYSAALDKYYTGHTDDLDKRLVKHNRGKTPFTESGIPWKLIYTKEFNSRKEAIRLETAFKKRGATRFMFDNDINVG